ncbi:MAG: cation:proton antiporter [Sandaracinaceae bacterium]|nr:cation:proton antiporter [Sandaracinaceae bacterium]
MPATSLGRLAARPPRGLGRPLRGAGRVRGALARALGAGLLFALVSATFLVSGARAQLDAGGAAPADGGRADGAGRDGGSYDAALDGGPADAAAGAGAAHDARGGAAPAEPEGRDVEPELERGHAEASAPGMVLRTVLALLACLALAYLAGHPRVQELEEVLGISQVVTAGFPFFALGAIAHLPRVGLLPDTVLTDLTPLLELGLGWIGLLAGLQFDVRVADTWPKGTANLTGVLTFVPFAIIAAAIGVLLYVMAIPINTERLLRDAAMFGAAGCLAAPTASALLATTGLSERAAHVVRSVAVVDDAAGVALLALLSAFYRPEDGQVGWALPGIGWLFVTLGMGVTLGALMYGLLRVARTQAESTALVLGSIALAAGIATVFSVSPIVTCFMAGIVLANLPGAHQRTVRAPLLRLERPIYLVFLFVAGALWRFDAWEGWLLLPAFVLARLLGRMLAARVAQTRGLLSETPGEEAAVSRAFVAAPIGALSIAIVVNVQTLYPGRAVPLMVTAVVGGALVSEVLVQLTSRLSSRPSRPAPTREQPSPGDPAPEEPAPEPPLEGPSTASKEPAP